MKKKNLRYSTSISYRNLICNLVKQINGKLAFIYLLYEPMRTTALEKKCLRLVVVCVWFIFVYVLNVFYV